MSKFTALLAFDRRRWWPQFLWGEHDLSRSLRDWTNSWSWLGCFLTLGCRLARSSVSYHLPQSSVLLTGICIRRWSRANSWKDSSNDAKIQLECRTSLWWTPAGLRDSSICSRWLEERKTIGVRERGVDWWWLQYRRTPCSSEFSTRIDTSPYSWAYWNSDNFAELLSSEAVLWSYDNSSSADLNEWKYMINAPVCPSPNAYLIDLLEDEIEVIADFEFLKCHRFFLCRGVNVS